MKFKPLKWIPCYDIHWKRNIEVRCGQAQVALIVWRSYKKSTKVSAKKNDKNGHWSVFLRFEGSGAEHAIPTNDIEKAKLFVKDRWKEFKNEITK